MPEDFAGKSKFDVREDEEQLVKLQEVIELLVAAGYFRARIKGLSAFDKVVGGMVWCIEMCNFDVDVDLLFQENLTIGQKISLTEKIVAVLPKMNCPHRIEPHQIQGLDCIHIFPVIQWLVKKAMETRQDMGDLVRSYAVNQFNKFYSFKHENEEKQQGKKLLKNIKLIKDAYCPQRQFRQQNIPPDDEEYRVQCTLLEYGWFKPVPKSDNATASDLAAQIEQPQGNKSEELDIQKMIQKMSMTGNQDSRVSAGIVGSIVNLQAKEIAQVVDEYSEGKGGDKESHNHILSTLQKQKISFEEMEGKLVNKKDKLESEIQNKSEILDSISTKLEEVQNEISSLQSLETTENQSALKKLRELVILKESLIQNENNFKEQCKAELAKLKILIKNTQDSEPDESEEQNLKLYEEEKEKVQALRLVIAKKNRSIAALQRQLDEIPGRAELAQYQRRFLELYNQVSTKHKETKQFYTLYNTLDDTKQYLGKELTLLNSILDNYTEAMSSSSTKEQYMKQLDAIIEGVKQNKLKVERRHCEERNRRDRLSNQLSGLVDLQRQYVAAVRQLTVECKRNETLLQQLRANKSDGNS